MILTERLRSMVLRGKIVAAVLNPKRPLLQITARAGEAKNKIELFVPMGYSCYPSGDEDLVMFRVGGSPAHVIAFADAPALRITDLQKGEFGLRDGNGQQIVFRGDRLEITSPLKLAVNIDGDADVSIGGDADISVDGDLDLSVGGDADISVDGDADIDADSLTLCGGSAKVALDGDPVVDGKVQSSATKVTAA